jgi:hypothetical protein
MNDKLSQKVIDLFCTHKKSSQCASGKVCKSPEGYSYVTIETDENGRHFDEEKLLKRSKECYYIVKIMIKKGACPQINNFKIQGDKILDFIKLYLEGGQEGQIIEIDKFYPEEWA